MNLWTSACEFWYGDTSLIYSNTKHKLLFYSLTLINTVCCKTLSLYLTDLMQTVSVFKWYVLHKIRYKNYNYNNRTSGLASYTTGK